MSAADPNRIFRRAVPTSYGWAERLDGEEEWAARAGSGFNQKSPVGKVTWRTVPQGLFADAGGSHLRPRPMRHCTAATVTPLSVMMPQVIVQ